MNSYDYDAVEKFLGYVTDKEFESLVNGFLHRKNIEPQKVESSTRRSRTSFCGWLQQKRLLEDFMDYAQNRDNHADWFSIQAQERSELPVQFVNREDELRILLSAAEDDKFFLIAAPPGYGKTWLVKEIARRLQKREYEAYSTWNYVVVQILNTDAIETVAQQIAKQLGFELLSKHKDDETDLERFYRSYRKFCRYNAKTKQFPAGTYWLFDFEGLPNRSIHQILVNKFLLKLFEINAEFHPPPKNRLILIGRFIVPGRSDQSGSTPSYAWRNTGELKYADEPQSLTPFNFPIVLDTINKYWNERDLESEQVAAHIFHYTAGHPQSIHRLLIKYDESGTRPEDFFAPNQAREIWRLYVKNQAERVYNELLASSDEQFLQVKTSFEKLAVFPTISLDAIKKLAEKIDINHLMLRNQLLDTYMLQFKGRLLQDSIC